MRTKTFIKVVALCVALSCISSVALAVSKHSNSFQYKYEGNFLPSDANTSPRWERGFSGGNVYETYYCSTNSGILTIDTAQGPSATEGAYYALPGEYSNLINEFYTWPDPANPWNVNMDLGYTVEIKFKVDGIQIPDDPNYPGGKFAFWIYLEEGLHGQLNCVQIFPDKIAAVNSSTPDILYTGDLTNKFYTLRIVRNPGAVEVVQDVYDFYLDDVLIASGISSPATAAYDQDALMFGDAAGGYGGTDIKIEIDYLRIDLTGAYQPTYLVSDIDENRVTDFSDFALLAKTWLLSTDVDVAGYIDCTNPVNVGICQ
jgi:hypothetical protein